MLQLLLITCYNLKRDLIGALLTENNEGFEQRLFTDSREVCGVRTDDGTEATLDMLQDSYQMNKSERWLTKKYLNSKMN